MKCALTKVGFNEFQGNTGDTFDLSVGGDGAPQILDAGYAGTTLTAPPWQFEIQSGTRILSVHVTNTPNANTTILEDCDSQTMLDEWVFAPDGDVRTIIIDGAGAGFEDKSAGAPAVAQDAKPRRRGKRGRSTNVILVVAALLSSSAAARAQTYKYGDDVLHSKVAGQTSRTFEQCQAYLDFTGVNITKLILLASKEGPKKFAQMAENVRLDKQIGSNPSSAGTTSLVSKSATSQLIGLAVEEGAVTETNSQAVTTLHANAINIARLFQSDDSMYYCPALAKCETTVTSILAGLSGSVSLNATNSQSASVPVNSGSNNAVLANSKQQVTSWGLRYDLNSHKKVSAKAVTQAVASVNGHDYFKTLEVLIDETKGSAGYKAWLEKYANMLQKAPNASAFDKISDTAAYALIALAEESSAEFQKQIDQAVTTMATYFGTRDNALDQLIDKVTYSFEYNDNRPANQPSQSTLTTIVGYRLNDQSQFTFNGAATWYNSVPAQASVRQFRDAQAALQADYSFTDSSAKLGIAGSAGFYYQYQADNALLTIPSGDLAPGTSIALPGSASVLLGTKGSIAIGQVGLTFSVPNTGIKLPFAISYANRTDLIKASDVRGHFGITYDFDSLFASN